MIVQVLRLFGASSAVSTTLSAIFSIWLIVLIWSVSGEHLLKENTSEIGFFIILLSFVAAISTATLLTPLRSALVGIPHEFLLLPQGLRVFFGAGFLIEAALAIIPPAFGIVDGISHITAAFLALTAAIIHKSHWRNRHSLWAANLFGLLDIIVVAIGIAFFLLQKIGPHHNVMYAAFFAAPVFISMHVISIYKLLVEKTTKL